MKEQLRQKRILIINGSPRKKGNISGMLEIMRQEAVDKGVETGYVNVNDLTIRPCTGCMRCRSMRQCCLPEDDAQRVLEMIRRADALVIGAPCYWGNIPGQMKLLFDRIVYGMMDESPQGLPKPLHKGKQAIIVSACTVIYPFNILFNQSHGAIRALKEILKWSGFGIKGTLEKGGTNKYSELTEREKERCRKLIRRIIE